MLKVVLLCVCITAVAVFSAPTTQPPAQEPIAIISNEFDSSPNGTFHYSYESADGSKASESGELKGADPEHSGIAASGSYEYQSPDGEKISVNYVADENGFQPTGDHLPKPPPIPEQIARALRFIEEHQPPAESVTKVST